MGAESRTLLNRVAQGDSTAFNECVDTYGGLVWSLARRFSPSRADAEDAVQEVFLDVWKNAERFDPEKGSEVTFVAMIARRRMIDLSRRRDRRIQLVDGDDAAVRVAERPAAAASAQSDSARLDQEEELRAASEALDELKPDQQRAIRLAVQYGLTHEQIAEQTGMPLGTVKTHVRRGLLSVRERLRQASGREASERGARIGSPGSKERGA